MGSIPTHPTIPPFDQRDPRPIGGREKLLSLGVYPQITLKTARVRGDEARHMVLNGVDPAAKRQAEKQALGENFESVAREWLNMKEGSLTPGTLGRERDRLEDFIFPYLGKRPIAQIKAPELLAVLRRVESRGIVETAHRTKSVCSRIFRYAIATGRAERDVAADLKGALKPSVERHLPAITNPARIGELLRAIDGCVGQGCVAAALKLAPYVFLRPGELRKGEWAELDWDNALWRIPAERMKMREAHLAPLSTQALAILKELRPVTGAGRLIFPSIRTRERPISDNTLNAALRRIGYTSDEMVAHGFRSMACTLLNEQGWRPDLIERQLAHAERNQVRAAYNRAQWVDERRKMMQGWADYLDRLRTAKQPLAVSVDLNPVSANLSRLS
ncbi:MAG TPA: tyrosine-type recombinase/integrase [Steroidobacteraceae bacterium]|nr:tyrosine-type recombinase/integrase [Steroidobacteraceae bacterium]